MTDPIFLPRLTATSKTCSRKRTTRLTRAVEEMREAGLPEISVSPVLGKHLYLLAKLVRARRILEIGTLGGYSAIWLGRALPEDGHMITLEIDPLHAKVARRNLARAKLFGTVEVREGPALELLQKLIDAGEPPFDLIFIDADKEPYLDYFELSLRLSRPGTLIVADNMIRQGEVIDPAAPDARVARREAARRGARASSFRRGHHHAKCRRQRP